MLDTFCSTVPYLSEDLSLVPFKVSAYAYNESNVMPSIEHVNWYLKV